jgi:hypothetical protein
VSVSLNIPYSAQYNTTTREGHEHPPPTFGAPTLVWHLAISPHWPEKHYPHDAILADIHGGLARTYEDTRTAFFADVNRLLEALQKAAGFPAEPIQKFNSSAVPAPYARKGVGAPFYIALPGSVRFTLWWSDTNKTLSNEPTPDALRIKVFAGAHRDYVTLGLYLDVAKPWNAPPQTIGGPIVGERRKKILSEVDRVRKNCEARMSANANGLRPIDCEMLPERDVSDPEALSEASRYLYSGVWDDFCKSTGIDSIAGGRASRVFANFRGLVIATDGLPEAAEPRQFPGSAGAEPFPRFKGNGGIDHTGTRSSTEPNEANAVLKAFWPFIRRSTPDADRKEFVACGAMSWRALYVTTLNCPPSFEWREEAREPPAGHLLDAPAPGREEPVRYLLITKGEPHRQQIGRIVERINAMGTMRLIALRDYSIIRDASTQIQLRGQELDKMMRKWSVGRAQIRKQFEPRKAGKSGEELSLIKDKEDEEVQNLADKVEQDLIDLSAALDEVSTEAVHGLHFRINRSRYYVCEFESLLASLKIGNIDTWVSYDQFVTRGLKPAFDFVDGVGTRLLGLRARLQSVLEGIETSALVKQTAATRLNTAELRNIAKAFTRLYRLLRWIGVALGVISLAVTLLGLQGYLGKVLGWLQGL